MEQVVAVVKQFSFFFLLFFSMSFAFFHKSVRFLFCKYFPFAAAVVVVQELKREILSNA